MSAKYNSRRFPPYTVDAFPKTFCLCGNLPSLLMDVDDVKNPAVISSLIKYSSKRERAVPRKLGIQSGVTTGVSEQQSI